MGGRLRGPFHHAGYLPLLQRPRAAAGYAVAWEDVPTRCASSELLRLLIQPVLWVADHHHGPAGPDLGVQYFAVGMRDLEQLLRAKRSSVEGEAVSGAVDMNVGTIAFKYRAGRFTIYILVRESPSALARPGAQ
jgi:hypothetical protein